MACPDTLNRVGRKRRPPSGTFESSRRDGCAETHFISCGGKILQQWGQVIFASRPGGLGGEAVFKGAFFFSGATPFSEETSMILFAVFAVSKGFWHFGQRIFFPAAVAGMPSVTEHEGQTTVNFSVCDIDHSSLAKAFADICGRSSLQKVNGT